MKNAIISAEAISIIISIVLLYANSFETTQRTRKRHVYSVLVAINLIAMAADMGSWLVDGIPALTQINFLLTSVSTILSFAVSAVFVYYIYLYIYVKHPISFTMFGGMIWFSIAGIIVVALACLTNQIFYIEDGFYYEGPMYNLYLFANGASLVYALIILCFSSKYLGLHDSLAAFSYILLPCICIGINAVNPEFSMVYPAITVSILITFIFMQSEHESILIQQDKQKEQQMIHDVLTGLPNRFAYKSALEAMANADAPGVIFCDINGLKYTNDHFGHQAGDQLICDFAHILTANFRKDDIFRISGDEFVILLPNISPDVLEQRAASLRKILEGYQPPLASVGHAGGKDTEIKALINSAEAGMYEEKKKFYVRFPNYRR